MSGGAGRAGWASQWSQPQPPAHEQSAGEGHPALNEKATEDKAGSRPSGGSGAMSVLPGTATSVSV